MVYALHRRRRERFSNHDTTQLLQLQPRVEIQDLHLQSDVWASVLLHVRHNVLLCLQDHLLQRREWRAVLFFAPSAALYKRKAIQLIHSRLHVQDLQMQLGVLTAVFLHV